MKHSKVTIAEVLDNIFLSLDWIDDNLWKQYSRKIDQIPGTSNEADEKIREEREWLLSSKIAGVAHRYLDRMRERTSSFKDELALLDKRIESWKGE